MLVSGEREIVNFYSVHVFFSFLKYESMSGFHSKGCLRLNEDNARMDIDFNHLIAHIPMPPLSKGKEKWTFSFKWYLFINEKLRSSKHFQVNFTIGNYSILIVYYKPT